MSGSTRLVGLDLARGIAVVSMIIAHLSPVGGIWNLSEFLTAPLFATIVGTAAGLWLSRGPRVSAVLATAAWRGAVLITVGVLLQRMYDQIDVVLQTLGLLTLVVLPLGLLLWKRPVWTLALAGVGALASPALRSWGGQLLFAHPGWTTDWRAWMVEWTVAGYNYRLTSFLPMALAGMALARLLPDRVEGRRGWLLLAGFAAVAGSAQAFGRLSGLGADAYSGTTPEVVAAIGLGCGTIVGSFLVVAWLVSHGAVRWVEPLIDTGRLAFTAYSVQILYLALVALFRPPLARDDAWPILVSTLVVVVGSSWWMYRRWGTGPLEWVIRLVPPRRSRRPMNRGDHRAPLVAD